MMLTIRIVGAALIAIFSALFSAIVLGTSSPITIETYVIRNTTTTIDIASAKGAVKANCWKNGIRSSANACPP